ncbi:NAD(P)-dependent oxidoreductase [Acidobacterium sp. S8]|uniref:NAD(P)-dependent oxidoreductase n=1 Tax=Acidobacterium sp. S8 TaxID=1641854 RepID=UPI00131D84C1|nr:NAD(P)-dependent oxidoreductase [Acidobacterium sp. S8]
MRPFKAMFTGDYLDESGQMRGQDIGVDALNATGFIETGFLLDQKPTQGDSTYWDRLYSLEITAEHIANANAIVIIRPWLKAEAFSKGAENLIVIARAGAGYDKIDTKACTKNNVVVFNAPDSLTHSTASAAFTFMLALAKRLPQQEAVLRSGRWDRQSEIYGDDLIGKTLGIIGLGKTGLELARLAAPFHMKILAYSPRADRFAAEALGVELVSNLETLLSVSDFVSLHCRLEKHTRGLLDAQRLKLLKPTAYLINVARGEIIDEEALVKVLQENAIAGAGLDVFDTEPLPPSSCLLALDNVILTPHWLPSTRRAAQATREVIVQNLIRVATGQIPQNILNPEVLGQPEFRQKLAQFEENRHNG